MLVIQRPTVEALGEAEGNRQRFAISPLEPGFGHTLGNSLRRTLLSSIPGAADHAGPLRRRAPRVRHHRRGHRRRHRHHPEPQGPRAQSTSDEPVTCASTCAVPPKVTAGDIQTPPTSRSSTRDLHIATLNAKGRLAIDITVERGPRLRLGRPQQAAARPSASSRSTRSSRRCAGSPSTSSPPASSSPPTTTASCSTSRPTARSRPARPSPRPAPRCARSWTSSPT